MASFIGTNTISNPLTAPIDANGFDIVNGATYQSLRSEVQTLAVPASSGFAQIECEDDLRIIGDKALSFGAPTAGTASIKIQGDPGADVEFGPIPAGAQANVIGYDTATNKLTYFATPGGGTGTLTGVGAGNNISVNNTNPAVPVVSLASPLTSDLDVGSRKITTTTIGTMTIENPSSAINLNATQVGLNTTGNTFISGSGAGSRLAVSMGGNQRLEVDANGVNITPGFSGGGGSLSVIGGDTNPLLVLQTTSGLNKTCIMNMNMSRNTGAFPSPGDVITQITSKGDNYLGNLVDYTQIESVIQNIGSAGQPTNVDGTLNFKCITNNAYNTYISLNGSSQQINMGKDVLMGANNIQNVGYVGLTAGVGGVGLSGQSLVSGGGSQSRWNFNMACASVAGSGGGTSLNTGSFTDIVGGLAISLPASGFVTSPVNRYKVTINGTFDNVADAVRMYMEIQANGTGAVAGGDTFNSGSSLYYYTEHISGFGTAYTTYSFSDVYTCTLNQGGTATINLWVEPATGSHTIGNNRHQISIEPLPA